ncbi:hypothetical protein V6N13_055194 [Hibiscus sabdariffa]|uniref:Uncharacterized protein n=2 Tax=Hibiscus sabdariffa TaxID=183260 RepID=A0ABR2B409_9ROSI
MRPQNFTHLIQSSFQPSSNPSKWLFMSHVLDHYAQFAWTTTFGTVIVQQTPLQSHFYLSGPNGMSGTNRVGTGDDDDDDDDNDDVDDVSVDVYSGPMQS